MSTGSQIQGGVAVAQHPDPHGNGHAPHAAHLAHHFDTPEQQFMSAKLGMWVFLGTEILMFGGLFCAYSVYRHNHPEVFEFAAAKYLSTALGALNTVVLITSSLTMAWGVRCAQLSQKKGLIICLILTLLGACGFLVVKGIEYHNKWEEHVWFGTANQYYVGGLGAGVPAKAVGDMVLPPGGAPAASDASAAKTPPPDIFDPNAGTADEAKIRPVAMGPQGLAPAVQAESIARIRTIEYKDLAQRDLKNVATFFNIYFLMTGLHGLHVLVGMGLITWILIRAAKDEFSSEYFTPVDLVGLYWHLVDLIWIFLFPLLYLIH